MSKRIYILLTVALLFFTQMAWAAGPYQGERGPVLYFTVLLVATVGIALAGISYYRNEYTQTQVELRRCRSELLRKDRQLHADERRVQVAQADKLIEQSEIYRKLKRMVDHPSPNDAVKPADWHELSRVVNEAYTDFSSRLRSFCRLSHHEQAVCLLLKAHFSPSEIAALTNHTVQSVSNTRARLYQKVHKTKGGSAKWDDFIENL